MNDMSHPPVSDNTSVGLISVTDTIALLYRSAVDDSLWSEVAERMAKLFGADAVALCHTVNGQVRLLGEGVYNLSTREADQLGRQYAQNTVPRALPLGLDESARGRVLDDAGFARQVPQLAAGGRLLTVVVPDVGRTEGAAPTHLSLAHSEGRLRFDDGQHQLRELISGHLVDAVRLQMSLDRKNRIAEFHNSAVLHLGEAWLVIDRNDQLIECNPIARSFLLRSPLLGIKDGRVRVAGSDTCDPLRDAMQRAWQGDIGHNSVSIEPGDGIVSFDLRPVFRDDQRSSEKPDYLMILVRELNREIMMKIEKQAETCGLSRAELRVLVQLVRLGQNPAEIADAIGTSERTIRCQLSSIFRKTGTRTQQEIIRRTLLG